MRQDGSETEELRAIVDSGCNRSTFPTELAPELGIDLAACAPVRGLTASGADDEEDESSWMKHWPPGIDTKFWNRTIHLEVFFRNAEIPILLGREDFFRCFKVLFDERNQRFSLQPYKKP
jgi:Aspartyl protease